jgi:hypothetical protein
MRCFGFAGSFSILRRSDQMCASSDRDDWGVSSAERDHSAFRGTGAPSASTRRRRIRNSFRGTRIVFPSTRTTHISVSISRSPERQRLRGAAMDGRRSRLRLSITPLSRSIACSVPSRTSRDSVSCLRDLLAGMAWVDRIASKLIALHAMTRPERRRSNILIKPLHGVDSPLCQTAVKRCLAALSLAASRVRFAAKRGALSDYTASVPKVSPAPAFALSDHCSTAPVHAPREFPPHDSALRGSRAHST